MEQEGKQAAEGESEASLHQVMGRALDRAMARMTETVMDRMAERWRRENRQRVERAVVETARESRAEEEPGPRVRKLVGLVADEVARLMEQVMGQVEGKLQGKTGEEEEEDSSVGQMPPLGAMEEEEEEDSVCQMPPLGAMEEEDEPLTPNQLEAFQEIFQQLSHSGKPVIDFTSLKTSLEDIGVPANEVVIHGTLEAMDSDGDGEATFEDFLRLATSTCHFVAFHRELPDRCEGSGAQTGSVDDTIFFQVLARLIQMQMLSEEATRTLSRYYYRKKKGARLKTRKQEGDQVLPLPLFLGQTIYTLATYVDVLEPDEVYQEVPPSKEEVRAFRELFEMFSLDERGCIDVNSLLKTLAEVEIHLESPLIPDEMKCAEVNGGKEVSFQDLLRILTDTGTFARYLAPEIEACPWGSAPTLLFHAVNRLVSSPFLSAKTRGIIASYYRGKFTTAAAQGCGVDGEPLTPPAGASKDRGTPDSPPAPPPPPPAKGSTKAHPGKIKEPWARRRENIQRRFQAALKNPAFLEAFKAYSWTWKESGRL
ncbi:uncharacterized protein [Narcine bancroftii]|uniref:uncharacterized protein n=1 Tax=Narcine bancroftii TaxID=1343680 RepID=UPI003831FC6F